jgi:hypothetical protein
LWAVLAVVTGHDMLDAQRRLDDHEARLLRLEAVVGRYQ